MKKLSLLSILVLAVTSTSACSIFYGKDKNELQPKLGAAARTPVNPALAQAPAPQMIGFPAQPGQPEAFVNANVGGLNTAPSAVPGNDFPVQDQAFAQPVEFQPPVQPQYIAPAPQQPVTFASQENVVIAQISKNKRLPASLQADYNNPLNYEGVPVNAVPANFNANAFAPAAPVAVTQTTTTTTFAPAAPASTNVAPVALPTQPVNAPTQPVDQLQLYTTDPKAQQ